MRRRICVVTGSRAEYGLLRWVMQGIRECPDLELQLVATGMHLSPEFGLTWREIVEDGFAIDRKVEMLLSSDTAVGLSKSAGLAVIGFGEVYAELAPDLVLVLGDRLEILAAATAAMLARIPIAHAHGGEASEGAIDEACRHAITKLAHLHFVAAPEYHRRVLQLGEQPERVFLVGGLGVDAIRRQHLLDRASIESSLGVKLHARNLMVTFHSATLEHATAADQMAELLAALENYRDVRIIFTLPNADADGRVLLDQVRDYVAHHENACVFTSLGQRLYLSCLKLVDGVVGNSSSGLTEAPSLATGTINIGDRQRGRLRASSVIDCAPDRSSIGHALHTLFSADFRATLPSTRNPYGDGGASERIVSILASTGLKGILKKRFHDQVAREGPTTASGVQEETR